MALGEIYERLYELVVKEAQTKRKGSRPASGHVFEDLVAKKIYQISKELGIKGYPPRYTLRQPTYSGINYQFDSCFEFDDKIFVVECKRTSVTPLDYIYYFNSKIQDYNLVALKTRSLKSLKGIFISTVPVGENSMIYAFAYNITVIDPTSPPLELMLEKTDSGSNLHSAIKHLYSKLPDSIAPHRREKRPEAKKLYRNYLFLKGRFQAGKDNG